ncbi:MAG: HAD family hydrolase, partial [Sphingomonas sp.]
GLPIRHVVFDFDGTLVDSNRCKLDGFHRIAELHPGGSVCMEEVLQQEPGNRQAKIASYVQRMRILAPGLVLDVDRLVARYSADVDAAVSRAPEMVGAQALLDLLRRQGLSCYLSSATPLANLRAIIENRGWIGYFEGIFGHPATKIETLKLLFERTGTPASGFAVIGDGADDRDSADATGCRFFSVGEGRGSDAGQPVYQLHDLAALFS